MNIEQLIIEDLGRASSRNRYNEKRPWWVCPFHSDTNPSFTVTENGLGYICFGCGEKGDAIDWLRRHRKLSFPQAQLLVTTNSRLPRRSRGPVPKVGLLAKVRTPPSQRWQLAATIALSQLPKIGQPQSAAKFLHARGLGRKTWQTAQLRFSRSGQTLNGIYIPAGLIIPLFNDEKLWGIRVRRLSSEGPKYRLVKGSVPGAFFPSSRFPDSMPLVVCEGELDCLLMNQELGEGALAITLGSANARPDALQLISLSTAPCVLLAFDNDSAGDAAASEWAQLLPRAIRAKPPVGKDVTEAFLQGTDLASWISGLCAPLGRRRRAK